MDNSDLEQLKSVDNTNKIIDAYIDADKPAEEIPNIAETEEIQPDPAELERQGRIAAINALSKDDKKSRRKQLNKLDGYFSSQWRNLFSDIIDERDWTLASELEIRDAIEECQECIAQHDNKQFVKDAYFSGVGIIEAFGPSVGLNCTGANNFIRKDKQVDSLLEQMYLARADAIQMSPEKKLLIATAKYMYVAHKINTTMTDRADSMRRAAIDAEKARKFADL